MTTLFSSLTTYKLKLYEINNFFFCMVYKIRFPITQEIELTQQIFLIYLIENIIKIKHNFFFFLIYLRSDQKIAADIFYYIEYTQGENNLCIHI